MLNARGWSAAQAIRYTGWDHPVVAQAPSASIADSAANSGSFDVKLMSKPSSAQPLP
jgi:hypothetical protein